MIRISKESHASKKVGQPILSRNPATPDQTPQPEYCQTVGQITNGPGNNSNPIHLDPINIQPGHDKRT